MNYILFFFKKNAKVIFISLKFDVSFNFVLKCYFVNLFKIFQLIPNMLLNLMLTTTKFIHIGMSYLAFLLKKLSLFFIFSLPSLFLTHLFLSLQNLLKKKKKGGRRRRRKKKGDLTCFSKIDINPLFLVIPLSLSFFSL